MDQMPLASGSLAGGGIPWERLDQALREAAPRFVGVQEVQDMLDRLERSQPALVREIVPRLIPPVLLAEVLSRLVEEGVPVRNLKGILLSLAEHARRESDPVQLSERVREALRPIISHRVAPDGDLRPWLLDPGIEEALSRGIDRDGATTSLSLPPEQGEAILGALERVLRASAGSRPVLLTRPEIRRPLWKLAANLRRGLFVVSYAELEPSVSLKPAGVVRLAPEARR
jgi:type III secretory pathway component EscV